MDNITEFIKKVKDFDKLKLSQKCDYFIYFFTEIKKTGDVSPKNIENCFDVLKIDKYSNIPQYLSQNSKKGKEKKFIKTKNGFHIERYYKNKLEQNIIFDIPHIEISTNLRDLLPKIKSTTNKNFLEEAIKSFEVSAYRSSIIMIWLLCMDVLYEHIIMNKLVDFNSELAKVTDKRVKVNQINNKDNFSDIPENKFIEICRSAKIISNDIRKILDVKLGIRNSAAHPSTISFGKGKTYEFIEDITTNVIIKFV